MINKNTASYSNHKSQLESAIWWLEQLIERKEKDEAFYQEFFEQNQIVFSNSRSQSICFPKKKEGGRLSPF